MAQNVVALKRDDIVAKLQADLHRLQGLKPGSNAPLDLELGPITSAFPNASFPLGAVHEFLYDRPENSSATAGFIAGLLRALMKRKGAAIWISTSRRLFPPALKTFGIDPAGFIFLDVKKERDVAWAMDEALKCDALTAVISEMRELNFTESRRLQLAVEKSQVTGFVMRPTGSLNTTACVSRWRVTPLSSDRVDQVPGIGFPKWRVELLRIRNGRPGTWDIQFASGRFIHSSGVQFTAPTFQTPHRKAG